MSTLLTNFFENGVTLSQNFRCRKGVVIHAVRLYLIKTDDLTDGTLTIEIKDGSNVLRSSTITYTELNAEGQYLQGMFAKELNLQLNGRQDGEEFHEYTIECTMSGFTGADLLGWVKEYENPKPDYYGTLTSDANRPFSFELLEFGR